MGRFLTPQKDFDFRPLGKGRVRLQGNLEYLDDVVGHLMVPHGFECDLASYGRIIRSIYDRLGRSMRPAFIHDFLYHVKVKDVSRADADRIYREALRVEGANRLSAWSQWAGVRAFGWRHY